jgi:hypothetical protein
LAIQISSVATISCTPTKITDKVMSSSAKCKPKEKKIGTKTSFGGLLSPPKNLATVISPRQKPIKTLTASMKVPQGMRKRASSLTNKKNDDSIDFSSSQVAEEMEIVRPSLPQE